MSTPARAFEFVTLDVFSRKPLEGNQLAVFTDARGLSDDEMQALARETNLSETTFILPRISAVEKVKGVRVRIFTVQEELPFAGHPTLGTAFVIRADTGKRRVDLDLNAGHIPVDFVDQPDGSAFGEMRQRDPVFAEIHPRDAVARATGVRLQDIADDLPIQTVSTGLPFTIVPLRSLQAVRGLRPDLSRIAEYLSGSESKFFYFVSRETEGKADLHARMIFYNGEDPATGSAAGCAAAWAVRHGVMESDRQGMIEQGIEMRRPSQIYIRATRTAGGVENVRVGGYCTRVMEGKAVLP